MRDRSVLVGSRGMSLPMEAATCKEKLTWIICTFEAIDTLTTPSSGIRSLQAAQDSWDRIWSWGSLQDCEDLWGQQGSCACSHSEGNCMASWLCLCPGLGLVSWENLLVTAWDSQKSKRSWTKSSSYLAAPMFGVRLERNVSLVFREGVPYCYICDTIHKI